MPRLMLVIHESQLIRKIVTGYALSELSDVLPETTGSTEEALKILSEKKYDVIISGMEMGGVDGAEIFKKMRRSGPNRETPFIILTATDTKANRQRLARSGVRHVLIAPFSGTDLSRLVNEASNPREKRCHERYSIPGTEANLKIQDAIIISTVINISTKGALCEFEYREEHPLSLRPFPLEVVFPAEYGHARAKDVLAALLRLNAMSWRPNHVPEIVRVAYKFVKVPEAAANTLAMVLGKASQDLTLTRDKMEDQG
ncbi:MAG: response regulator [Thermodesulfobacteriota bacterium]